MGKMHLESVESPVEQFSKLGFHFRTAVGRHIVPDSQNNDTQELILHGLHLVSAQRKSVAAGNYVSCFIRTTQSSLLTEKETLELETR